MALDTKSAPSSGIDLGGIAKIAELFTGKDQTQTTKGSSTGTSKTDSSQTSANDSKQSTSGTTSNAGTSNTANTGTITTQEGASPEAVEAIVKSVLEGTQGLANVTSGQNRAGLYNSTTNRLLVNDLMARAAAEGAKLNKSSTQTINTGTATNTAQAQQSGQVQSTAQTGTQQSTQNQQQTATQDQTVRTVVAPPISGGSAAKGLAAIQLLSALGGKNNLLQTVFGSTSIGKSISAALSGASNGITPAEAAANGGDVASGVDQSVNDGMSSTPVISNASSASGITPQTSSIQSSAPNIQQAQASTPSDNLSSAQSISPAPVQQAQPTIPDIQQQLEMSADTSDALPIAPDTSIAGAGAEVSSEVPIDTSAISAPDVGGDTAMPAPVVDASADTVDSSANYSSGDASAETGGGFDMGGFDPSAAVDATDLNFDFDGFSDNFGDWDLGFAEGGMVDKTKAILRANPQAEAAFKSGGDEPAQKQPVADKKESQPADDRDGPVKKNGNLGARLINYIRGYASGGRTGDYYSNNRMVMSYAEGGRVKPAKGYASGGRTTDLTNLGLRVKQPDSAAPLQVSTADSATGISRPITNIAGVQSRSAAIDSPQVQSSSTPIRAAPVPVRIAEGSTQGTSSVNTAKLNTNSGQGNPVSMTPTSQSSSASALGNPKSDFPTTSASTPQAIRVKPISNPNSLGAGPATDTPSVVGTVSENNAAVAGMGLAAVTAALGPVAGFVAAQGLNALGISHSSMNPISQTLSFVQNAVTSAFSGPDSGITASPDAVGGMSAPSVSVGGVTTTGASTSQDAQSAAAPASVASVTGNTPSPSDEGSGIGTGIGVGIGPSVDGIGGESTGDSSPAVSGENEGAGSVTGGDVGGISAGSVGGSNGENDGGVSSGGIGGVGGGTSAASSSAGDADGPSYSSGGDVKGAGTETSDSIPAWLSVNEFVLNADAVKAVDAAMGPDFLDNLNESFKPSQKKLEQGKKIHTAQVKQKVVA